MADENDYFRDTYEDEAQIEAQEYGFNNYYDVHYTGQVLDENDGDRQSVNDGYNSLQFGEFVDEEEDFDEFLRGKRGKARKKLRDSGVSRKDAKKQVRDTMGRTGLGKAVVKVGGALKKVGTAVVKVIKKTALAMPRGSYLALMRINYRGQASKIARAKDNPQYKSQWGIISSKWKKLGGNVSSLSKSADAGKNKKPFLCGKKCKGKLEQYKTFFNADGGIDDSALFEELHDSIEATKYANQTGVGEVSVGVMIASATAIIGTLAGVLGTIASNKREKESLAIQQKKNDDEMDLMSEGQKKALELQEKAIIDKLNPRNQILNNPDLSQTEKEQALASLDEALEKTEGSKMKKYLIYGGLGFVALIVIMLVAKKMGNKN